jgi:hypothetical protein
MAFSPLAAGDPYSTERGRSTERRFQAFIARMRCPRLLAFLPPSLALAALLGACAPGATTGKAPPANVAAADLPPIPICRDEMRAFIELTRLARQHGDGWVVFEPAVDALKQQIIDCVDENRAHFRGL